MSANASRPGRPRDAMLADVLDGLASSPRTLSPKYFYDKVGSLLGRTQAVVTIHGGMGRGIA